MNVRTAPLRHRWQARGMLVRLLWPLSWLMGVAVATRRYLYRQGWLQSHRLAVPVLVVGNVLLGGVGKTPVVMALVAHFQARGLRVGVISRGYGRHNRALHEVTAHCSAEQAGDEALLIAQRCRVPVVVAADRVAAGRHLLAQHPQTDVIISDDGLQHLALVHDLALCVFDERGLGNGWLFPAGPLREPWPRLSSVPQWVLSSAPPSAVQGLQAEVFEVRRELSGIARNAHGAQRPLSHWHTHPCHALAAIAKPERFFDMLRQHGVQLTRTVALPDHAPLTPALPVPPHGEDCLCTEKDATKLWPTHPHVWAVPLDVTLPADFLAALDEALNARLSSVHGHKTA